MMMLSHEGSHIWTWLNQDSSLNLLSSGLNLAHVLCERVMVVASESYAMAGDYGLQEERLQEMADHVTVSQGYSS